MTIIAEPIVTTEEGITVIEYKFDTVGAFIRVSRYGDEPWRLEIYSDESRGSTVADQIQQALAVKAAADQLLHLNGVDGICGHQAHKVERHPDLDAHFCVLPKGHDQIHHRNTIKQTDDTWYWQDLEVTQ
jgi:hypothetical protein